MKTSETNNNEKESSMCKSNQMRRPNAGIFQKIFRTALSTILLGLMCGLPANRASAQLCTRCPNEATATAIGVGFSILVNRGGTLVDVSGSVVGGCETLILATSVSYNRFGPAGTIGAGFVGGTGR